MEKAKKESYLRMKFTLSTIKTYLCLVVNILLEISNLKLCRKVLDEVIKTKGKYPKSTSDIE